MSLLGYNLVSLFVCVCGYDKLYHNAVTNYHSNDGSLTLKKKKLLLFLAPLHVQWGFESVCYAMLYIVTQEPRLTEGPSSCSCTIWTIHTQQKKRIWFESDPFHFCLHFSGQNEQHLTSRGLENVSEEMEWNI